MPEQNISRYYLLQIVPGLFGNWGVLKEWGRIGRSGASRADWYTDKASAQKASDEFLEIKLNRGYRYALGSTDSA